MTKKSEDFRNGGQRSASIRGANVTGEGTVIFPLSSEEPYRRYYWHVGQELDEILSHQKSAVDLSWLNSGNAPLIDSHRAWGDLSKQIGVIERAWLENGRVYVEARISDRDDLKGIKQDIISGIIRNVSVGYEIKTYEIDEDKGTFTVTRWTPNEASFVILPADKTVGVGRSTQTKGVQMTKATDASGERITTMPGVETGPTDEQRAEAIESAINDISALAAEHNIGDIGRSFIKGQLDTGQVPSVALFRGIARSKIKDGTPLVNNDIGLTERETQTFSVVRLMRALDSEANDAARQAAGFELEACQAAREKSKRRSEHNGMILPTELLRSWGTFEIDGQRWNPSMSVRAPMYTGTNPNIQTTDHLPDRFIEALYNASSFLAAGVTVLDGLDSNIEIPGADQVSQVVWLASEGADATETVPTFRKVSMQPHDVAGFTDIGRRMIQQSTIAIEAYARAQLIEAARQAIDTAGLYGSGAAGVPTGVVNTTGIGSVTFAAANPTRDEVVDMRTAVANTNRGRGVKYLGNSDMVGHFQKTRTDPGSGIFLMNNDATRLVGNEFIESNQVASGDLIAGVWEDAILGMWDGLQIDRSTERKFLSGGITFRVIQSIDVGVTRVGSFVLGNDGV